MAAAPPAPAPRRLRLLLLSTWMLTAAAAGTEELPQAATSTSAPAVPPPPAGPPTGPTAADLDTAIMLLGSVALVMTLFYLLHWHDDDIRTYSWNVISSSICTFTGVLIGMAWNSCFVFYVVGPPDVAGPVKTLLCNTWASIGWYVMLQLVLAFVSCAVPVPCFGRRKDRNGARQHGEAPGDELVTILLNLKCFAVLLGITNGASNLALWGLAQQYVPRSPQIAASFTLVCAFCIWVMFRVGACVRNIIARGDGKVDEYEKIWMKFTEETEDGAVCMTLAHLLVQATRFYIGGNLPLPNGQVTPGIIHTAQETKDLLVFGMGYLMLIPVFDVLVPSFQFLSRLKNWLKKTAGSAAAFCWLYGSTWALQVLNITGVMGSMTLALVVTLGCFTFVFMLDYITDMQCTGPWVDKEVKAMIGPLSLLIGFAWKQAFGAALTTVVAEEHFAPPPLESLAMAASLAVVVVPAWRMYILPVVMHEEVLKEERIAEKEAAEGRSHRGSTVTPLLADQDRQGSAGIPSPHEARSLENGQAGPGLGSAEELGKRNQVLAKRNAELEASIRDIRRELGELKKLAGLLA